MIQLCNFWSLGVETQSLMATLSHYGRFAGFLGVRGHDLKYPRLAEPIGSKLPDKFRSFAFQTSGCIGLSQNGTVLTLEWLG